MVYLGSTPRLKISWKDIDGTPLIPDTQEWKIYDPTNELKGTNTDPYPENGGIYYWDYTILVTEKAGIWKLVAEATKGDRQGVVKLTFRVEET